MHVNKSLYFLLNLFQVLLLEVQSQFNTLQCIILMSCDVSYFKYLFVK